MPIADCKLFANGFTPKEKKCLAKADAMKEGT